MVWRVEPRVPTLVLCCAVSLVSHAAEPQAVPIEQEPSHHLVLQNAQVRVFEVRLPPGKDSLWHVHRRDGSSVRLTEAMIVDEPLVGEARPFHLHRGDVSFGATPAAMTHRVRNTGATDFHNIYIELQAAPVQDVSPTAVSADPRVVLENGRVAALRRVLAPGEMVPMHTHAADAVAVIVTPGRLAVSGPAGVAQTNDVTPGAVRWVPSGTTHALRNVGDTAIEIVDVEIK